MRIYPVPFRLLDYDRRYSKYDWIEASFSKNTRDPRPEKFRPNDPNSFFLGTTLNYHSWATNPRVIIGVFPAPHVLQPSPF